MSPVCSRDSQRGRQPGCQPKAHAPRHSCPGSGGHGPGPGQALPACTRPVPAEERAQAVRGDPVSGPVIRAWPQPGGAPAAVGVEGATSLHQRAEAPELGVEGTSHESPASAKGSPSNSPCPGQG